VILLYYSCAFVLQIFASLGAKCTISAYHSYLFIINLLLFMQLKWSELIVSCRAQVQ